MGKARHSLKIREKSVIFQSYQPGPVRVALGMPRSSWCSAAPIPMKPGPSFSSDMVRRETMLLGFVSRTEIGFPDNCP